MQAYKFETIVQENSVIQRPEMAKLAIDDFTHEIELTRQNKQLMKLLAERGKQTQTISFEEAKAQLGL